MVFFQCLPMQIFLNFKIISFSLCLNGYSLLVLSVPFVREMPCFTDKCWCIVWFVREMVIVKRVWVVLTLFFVHSIIVGTGVRAEVVLFGCFCC